MPAIYPARLKIQAAQLAERFGDSLSFQRGLHTLLETYANRAHRPGPGAPTLLSAYHVPLPVLRQLLVELKPYLSADPQAGLTLCDRLWSEPNLEFRTLAAMLLGEIPPQPPEQILVRIKLWGGRDTESRLLKILLANSLARISREAPGQFLHQIETWLASESTPDRQIGLRAVETLLEEASFQNLPALYRMLEPLVRAVPPAVRLDLAAVMRSLARRSPPEAVYLLRQALANPDSQGTAWLIRRSLPAFLPEQQASLRAALREAAERAA